MKHLSIAIDGPSGAGKSTLARAAARELHILYVDTGAIYRTLGYDALQNGVDPKNEAAVCALLPKAQVELTHGTDGEQRMLLNGTDVSEQIRLPQVSMYASAVSAHPCVRAHLLETQRALARSGGVIMDGRDIGTVVLPDASVKIFLTASAQERARRRTLELTQRGTPQPFEAVLREIERRDWDDTHRAAAPLRQAPDAVVLDTTKLDFSGSLEALLAIVRERTQP